MPYLKIRFSRKCNICNAITEIQLTLLLISDGIGSEFRYGVKEVAEKPQKYQNS